MSDECAHCRRERLPDESFFWIHHGNPGRIPGYCVGCAGSIMRAAFRFVDLRRDRELNDLIAAVQPAASP